MVHEEKFTKINLSLCLPWRHKEEAEVWLFLFVNSALDLGEWLASRHHRFRPPPPPSRGKSYHYPLKRNLGELLSRSECFGEGKNLLTWTGIEMWFVYRPYRFLDTMATTLVLRYTSQKMAACERTIKLYMLFCIKRTYKLIKNTILWGYVVAQLVEALGYKLRFPKVAL